ncbi:helix-turn-helix domain-containing protein [Clostridium butyricum]|uniref:HTH cro/C1-type domain-containing protein n=1 Tax=Clostridium butyricum TaxID=1492 RepID=A0A2S7FF78_CLOBU|nr:helix-turn-helix transcriptional regulator [Clostridium butyricum]PPV17737.1 hypothetical protein AWN73_06960 [Clostridium butyricum]
MYNYVKNIHLFGYKKTIIKNTCTINIIAAEAEHLKNNTENKSIGFWLRYHRKCRNLSMQELANEVGLRYSSYIKNLEESRTNPNKEASKRLALYFKLDTKYFYDPYFEDTDDYDKKLYNYIGC